MLTLGTNDRFLFDRNGAMAGAAGSETLGSITTVVGGTRLLLVCRL